MKSRRITAPVRSKPVDMKRPTLVIGMIVSPMLFYRLSLAEGKTG